MRDIDENGLALCRIQARIFGISTKKTACSSPVFIRRFMYSGVAARMDNEAFLFEACDDNDVFNEIEEEFGESAYGSEKYTEEELYWIGYVYRYWAYTYGSASRQIHRIMAPKELRDLYYPYHSLDPSQAIARMLEAKGLDAKDMTARGVKILRRLIREKEGIPA